MNLYSKMLNIQNIDTEDLIKSAINEVKNELQGLSPERMCLIFSSYLYNALLKRHLIVHMIDTLDLGASYQHRFVIVYNGKESICVNDCFYQGLEDIEKVVSTVIFNRNLKEFFSNDLKLTIIQKNKYITNLQIDYIL